MPRDLESEKATLDGLPSLSREPDREQPSTATEDPQPLYLLPTPMIEERFKKMSELRPYPLLLNREDLDQCDWLEHAAFEPHEAASREKLDYRLHVCGSLCSGLFTSAYATSAPPLGPLVQSRTPPFPGVDAHDSDRKRVLLAHIIATQFTAPVVTDPSMDYPKDWREKRQVTGLTGHCEDGETICLHSLAVHPEFQGKGLGKVLLRGWVQRVKDAGIAKRIALICHEKYVPFYQKAGFKKLGESKCQYGGGGWFDMVLEFDEYGRGDYEI